MAASGAWVGTIGAGGGMWAKARDELRRPGFSGGGGGNPFEVGASRTAIPAGKATGAATFFKLASTGFTFGALPAAFEATPGEVFVTDLGTDFCATGVAGFLAGVAAVPGATFALTAVLSTGLLVAFGAGLPDALAIDFLGCGLAIGDFLMTVVLAAGFAGFLAAIASTVFVLGFGLTEPATLTALGCFETGFETGFTLALATGLATALGTGLDAAASFFAGLAATLAVVLDFFVCAFTSCLLWQTALG